VGAGLTLAFADLLFEYAHWLRPLRSSGRAAGLGDRRRRKSDTDQIPTQHRQLRPTETRYMAVALERRFHDRADLAPKSIVATTMTRLGTGMFDKSQQQFSSRTWHNADSKRTSD
jgi:hypothetical protein